MLQKTNDNKIKVNKLFNLQLFSSAYLFKGRTIFKAREIELKKLIFLLKKLNRHVQIINIRVMILTHGHPFFFSLYILMVQ